MTILNILVVSLFSLAVTRVVSGSCPARIPQKVIKPQQPTTNASIKSWKMVDRYHGDTFLDGWEFWDQDDPTHGTVNYQSRENAQSKGLAVVKDNVVTLSVDDFTNLPVGKSRDSVRLSTKKTYNGGLFIADFKAMPFGCSVWPAWWSSGPGWPTAGEIDIIEGINLQATNQYVVHTGANCTMDHTVKVTSKVGNTQCVSTATQNNGCTFQDTDTRSYGKGFNAAGGGVYAHLWDSNGIKIWHFSRQEIPDDITSGNPNPSSWPTPAAFYAPRVCDMAQHFYDHVLTLDITLCGDWAGPAYAAGGCPGTCAQAVSDPSNFVNAKWEVNYIAVYN